MECSSTCRTHSPPPPHPLPQFPTILCLCAELGLFQERVAVDLYIYCHYVCCLAVAWGSWVIASCLEGLCTICLISTPLQLINVQLFAYVCVFHIPVLVMRCSVSCHLWRRRSFLFETLLLYTVQHASIGLSEHVWPSACVVIVVVGEREQELKPNRINTMKLPIWSGVVSKKHLKVLLVR